MRIPWLHGWSPPPDRPWITRNRIICPRLVAKPHIAEESVKMATDSRK